MLNQRPKTPNNVEFPLAPARFSGHKVKVPNDINSILYI